MLVAGTSEYIHAASTRAKASVPCSVKTLSLIPAGRKTHAELIERPVHCHGDEALARWPKCQSNLLPYGVPHASR